MLNFIEDIKTEINTTKQLLEQLINDNAFLATVTEISNVCIDAIRRGNKILFAGNGGSAADAQHLAAELVSRFCFDRPAMHGIALTTDTSALTAIGNDYGYEYVFSRQIEAIAREGDVLYAISTSGNSKNILQAIDTAKNKSVITIGLTGSSGGKMNDLTDYLIKIPSNETAKIQECHILIGHIVCNLIEKEIFSEYNPKNIANTQYA